MGLNSALSIATSGLNVVQNAMTVASNNISNAGTSGYIKETANVQSSVTGNTGTGVRIAATTLATNQQVQKALYAQNADVAAYAATTNSLSNITALQGSTSATSGNSGTLSDELGNLQSALTSLTSTPIAHRHRVRSLPQPPPLPNLSILWLQPTRPSVRHLRMPLFPQFRTSIPTSPRSVPCLLKS